MQPSPHWFQGACDLKVDAISRQCRGDKRTDPADEPVLPQALPDISECVKAVGPAGRVPLSCGLPFCHQPNMEKKEGRDQEKAYHTGVSNESKGEGLRCNLTYYRCKRKRKTIKCTKVGTFQSISSLDSPNKSLQNLPLSYQVLKS